MKAYSDNVKDNGKMVFINNQEYQTKAEGVYDFVLIRRRNRNSVNPDEVKPSDVSNTLSITQTASLGTGN